MWRVFSVALSFSLLAVETASLSSSFASLLLDLLGAAAIFFSPFLIVLVPQAQLFLLPRRLSVDTSGLHVLVIAPLITAVIEHSMFRVKLLFS